MRVWLRVWQGIWRVWGSTARVGKVRVSERSIILRSCGAFCSTCKFIFDCIQRRYHAYKPNILRFIGLSMVVRVTKHIAWLHGHSHAGHHAVHMLT